MQLRDAVQTTLHDVALMSNTERELALAKALNWQAVELFPDVENLKTSILELIGKLDTKEDVDMDILDEIRKVSQKLIKYTFDAQSLHRMTGDTIRYDKTKAEAESKKAETKVLEIFVQLTLKGASILRDMLTAEQYDRYYRELNQQILTPLDQKLGGKSKVVTAPLQPKKKPAVKKPSTKKGKAKDSNPPSEPSQESLF